MAVQRRASDNIGPTTDLRKVSGVTHVRDTAADSPSLKLAAGASAACSSRCSLGAEVSDPERHLCDLASTETRRRWSSLRAFPSDRIAGGRATAAGKHESTVGPAIHYNEVVAAGLTSVSETAVPTALWDFEKRDEFSGPSEKTIETGDCHVPVIERFSILS